MHFVGHSQGGIIAANCLDDVQEEYLVKSITTFGTPLPVGYSTPAGIKGKYYKAQNDRTPDFSPELASLLTNVEGDTSGGTKAAHKIKRSYGKDDTVRNSKSIISYDSDLRPKCLARSVKKPYDEQDVRKRVVENYRKNNPHRMDKGFNKTGSPFH